MAKDVQQIIAVRPDFQVKRGTVKTESGLSVKKVASAIFDTASTDSAGVANTALGAHGLGVFLPTAAIITRAFYQVKTTFTSATDAATLAIHANGANDIVTATAISAGGNVWDAGKHEGIPVDTTATMVSLTAERELTVTVAAAEVLTAGKLILFVEYVLAL